jgi:hypothetical protein
VYSAALLSGLATAELLVALPSQARNVDAARAACALPVHAHKCWKLKRSTCLRRMSAIDNSGPCVLCDVSCQNHASRNGVAPDSLQTPSALSQGAGAFNAEFVWHVIEAGILVFRAEERRRKLREAADQAAETGRDTQVFNDSAYSLGEDAHTPNVHSRQVSAMPQHETSAFIGVTGSLLQSLPCLSSSIVALGRHSATRRGGSRRLAVEGEARPAPPQQVTKCAFVCTLLAAFSDTRVCRGRELGHRSTHEASHNGVRLVLLRPSSAPRHMLYSGVCCKARWDSAVNILAPCTL